MTILLFRGGDSVEREVSLESAAYTEEVLEEMGHTVRCVDVISGGRFEYGGSPVSLMPGEGFMAGGRKIEADIAFPMIHGHGGEDGILQSLLEAAGIPYVSEDTATSAIGMHKALQADIFRANNLKTPSSIVLEEGSRSDEELKEIISLIGSALVVKPESGGSSIGVHILISTSPDELGRALEDVFLYDTNALVQEYIHNARELEVGVIKDSLSGSILVMGPVEVVTESAFLDYSSKYSSASRVIPESDTDIPSELRELLCSSALSAFECVGGSMYMRVDFLVSGDDIFLNEINTIPGMTEHSHFPVLSGGREGLKVVFSILLNNAKERFRRTQELKRSI